MLAILTRLPWRWIGLAVAALAAIGAIVFGAKGALDDARQSGLKQGRSEIQAQWDAEKAGRAEAAAELTNALVERLTGIDGRLQAIGAKLNERARVIREVVLKEMANDPRYSSADCSLSDGVRQQVDAARGLSNPAAAPASDPASLPSSGAAVRIDFGAPR